MVQRYVQDDVQLPDLSSLSLSPKAQQQTPNSLSPGSSLRPGPFNQTPSRPSSSHSTRSTNKEGNEESQKLRDALEGAILSETPDVHWDDVAGLDQAKEELQEAVILPIKFPQLFTGTRKARKGMLLYGPPGTGKSYLAKAVATEVDCPLFSISSSDIMSKWLGESEKLVKTLFEMARERKPSIIFIDEIEAIAGSRDNNTPGSEHINRAKTELLVQMDGVGKDSNGVLVLAATNLPWMLDSAIRRRFQKRIHIGLPDFKARMRMFEIGVGKTPCNLTNVDFARLAQMSEGFSGSDISIVVQDALMMPVKKIHTATHYRKVMHGGAEKLTPCTEHDMGAIRMTWRQVPADKLLEPSLLATDFYAVIKKVKPSVSEADIIKAKQWTQEFGQEGA
ncbi:AAA-domain-containing protein [Lepidopterella palustris CBS 459.81]|uniref:AAA-domain-containing protein n=1 Tax=Lepidopterella palustris CBS 459.81 TaxID=1314670 RepID=A0A8E2DXV4_9PEZI|nr:AAA-domain-containing protein [Lepidopterella palustris CBS 459.81]